MNAVAPARPPVPPPSAVGSEGSRIVREILRFVLVGGRFPPSRSAVMNPEGPCVSSTIHWSSPCLPNEPGPRIVPRAPAVPRRAGGAESAGGDDACYFMLWLSVSCVPGFLLLRAGARKQQKQPGGRAPFSNSQIGKLKTFAKPVKPLRRSAFAVATPPRATRRWPGPGFSSYAPSARGDVSIRSH